LADDVHERDGKSAAGRVQAGRPSDFTSSVDASIMEP
jgi:hypothetical protein